MLNRPTVIHCNIILILYFFEAQIFRANNGMCESARTSQKYYYTEKLTNQFTSKNLLPSFTLLK